MRWWQGLALSDAQGQQVSHWLGLPTVVADLSWGTSSTVVHLQANSEDFILKAGSPANHHIGREITAYESYTAHLAQQGLCPYLVAAERQANFIVLRRLQGHLVEGTPSEYDPLVHEQAGGLLRLIHLCASQQHAMGGDRLVGIDYENHATAQALAHLDGPHRINGEVERHARTLLQAYRPQPVELVPTHGDWQPRNWLLGNSTLKVIDFGRFDLRPASSDLCRLAAQQWPTQPSLEAAFLRGYGDDPRNPHRWPIEQLREAIGTATWAYHHNLFNFEAQGHRMLTEALEHFPV